MLIFGQGEPSGRVNGRGWMDSIHGQLDLSAVGSGNSIFSDNMNVFLKKALRVRRL